MVECVECGKCFEPALKNPKQKFCKEQCRSKNWRRAHPDKSRLYNHRSRMKKVLNCRFCNNEIPKDVRASGVVYCSDECRTISQKEKATVRRLEILQDFRRLKEQFGCSDCGYNKYGGSIDFHHIDPQGKDKRIDNMNWKNQIDELKKCVIVCKNCHYELHHQMKSDLEAYFQRIESCLPNTKLLIEYLES